MPSRTKRGSVSCSGRSRLPRFIGSSRNDSIGRFLDRPWSGSGTSPQEIRSMHSRSPAFSPEARPRRRFPCLPACSRSCARASARCPQRAEPRCFALLPLLVPSCRFVDPSALAAGEEAGLVEVAADGRIAFSHPLYASAVYGSAPVARRREAHRALAEMVGDPEERARHLALAASGPNEEVAALVERAAVGARARGAPDAAAELSELALEADSTGEQRRAAAPPRLCDLPRARRRARTSGCNPGGSLGNGGRSRPPRECVASSLRSRVPPGG